MAEINQSTLVEERKWYHWYSPTDSKEERKLITKLDLLIIPYTLIAYWLRLTDASNLNTAYVAGLKIDLGFHGNQLVHFQTIYTLGSVLGQLPCAYLFPKIHMNWLVPGSLLGLAVFTLLEYRAQSYAELMAYRFLIGVLEGSYYPAVYFVLGSWYRADEYARRGAVFYIGLPLGTVTAGLLTAAASNTLNGVHGLAGWRWMFIITAAITFPVAIVGFFLWPGTPDKSQSYFLSEEELALARKQFSLAMLKKVFTSWHVYVLTFWDILWWNGTVDTFTGGYLLWITSLGRYSSGTINELGSTSATIVVITLSCTVNIIGMIILVIWDVPEAALWFAFNTIFAGLAYSAVIHGWASDILRHNLEERAFVLMVMNSFSQSSTAWTLLFVFKTVEGPCFLKGYSFGIACSLCFIAWTWLIKWLHDRQEVAIISREEPPQPQNCQKESIGSAKNCPFSESNRGSSHRRN
ncbi:MFS general substrate transporter [Stipitochalara longipes BDJ]|nr:MFS general substrate transporter [Stipitochalara longipes BDJ]